MTLFEGKWGFVRTESGGEFVGAGYADGAGVCGAPKALDIVIRQEKAPDGRVEWRFRFHPSQPFGALVTTIDADAERLTTRFLGDDDTFQRVGNALTMSMGSSRLLFERCPGQ